MDMRQTINITIDNRDKQEQGQEKSVTTDDSPGNSGNNGNSSVKPKSSADKPVKDVK